LRDVHVIYDGVCVLDLVRLDVAEGERLFLLGRSGSGKTTLLNLIKGRLKPSSGTVCVLGDNPCPGESLDHQKIQRRIAMIDQEFHLVPRMRLIDNILTGCLGRVARLPSLFGWYPAHQWAKADTILSEVGLDGLGGRRVDTLSGGQRQRAAIARALMQEVDIILADEPVSNLDPELAEDALDLLVQCVERRRVTLIVSLHQPALAKKFSTRLVGLSEGKVIYDGPPEQLTEEASDRVYRSSLTEMEEAHDGTPETVAKKDSGPNLRVLNR